jgi:hypothetical protein
VSSSPVPVSVLAALVPVSVTPATLLSAMVKILSNVRPPWSVTRTVMPCEVALS